MSFRRLLKANSRLSNASQWRNTFINDFLHLFKHCPCMLDHPITVVLIVFDTLNKNGLKVYKSMSIQTQEEHISHIKQSKSDRFQTR